MSWSRPATIDELAAELHGAGSEGVATKLISGGVGLSSAAFPDTLSGHLVDVGGLVGRDISIDAVGAGVTLANLAASTLLPRVLVDAAGATANPNVRRRITVGGVIGWAGFTADLPVALTALRAQVECLTPSGAVEWLPIADVLGAAGLGGTGLVVLQIRIPPSLASTSPTDSAYRRIAGRAGPAPGIASVAAVRTPDGIELVAGAVAVGGPLRLSADARPGADDLVSDARASARHRARLVNHLIDLVLSDLETTS